MDAAIFTRFELQTRRFLVAIHNTNFCISGAHQIDITPFFAGDE